MRGCEVIAVLVGLMASTTQAAEAELDEMTMRQLQIVSTAFDCHIYALHMEDRKESTRLFELGYKSAQAVSDKIIAGEVDLLEMSGSEEPPPGLPLIFVRGGPSKEFFIGGWYTEITQKTGQRVLVRSGEYIEGDTRKNHAEYLYREANCALIQSNHNN